MTLSGIGCWRRMGRRGRGCCSTAHGEVETPVFMPVGTAGTVKAMTADQVRATGAGLILGNTYHLMLRPGADRVERLGGLHRFMDWPGPILTDSGGFQVMSLSGLRKMDEGGVTFQSHLDGSAASADAGESRRGSSGSWIPRSRWCWTSARRFRRRMQVARGEHGAVDAVGGAVAGGRSWRGRGMGSSGSCRGACIRSCGWRAWRRWTAIGFEGYAVGGLAVGEGQAMMLGVLDATVPLLPWDRPRYLMGVGTPDDLLASVASGDRHVRLRDADAGGADGAGVHERGGC